MGNFNAPAITAVTESGCTVSWTSDIAWVSRVDYGLTLKYGSSFPDFTGKGDPVERTSHSHVITGLTPGCKYYFRPVVFGALSDKKRDRKYYFDTPMSVTISPNLSELIDPLRLEHAVVVKAEFDSPTGTKYYSFDDLNLDTVALS